MENIHAHMARNTLIVTPLLALLGAFIAYLTDWMIVIPLLFGLGIPMINSRKPLGGKIRTTILILLGTTAIFTGAVILMLNIEYTRIILQATVVGAAGCLVLVLNGLLIKSIQLNFWSIGLTFLLAALSLPTGMWVTANLPATGGSILANFIGQYGIMILWMFLTTAGIVYAMKGNKQTSQLNN